MREEVIKKFSRLENFIKDTSSARMNVEIIKATGEHHKKGCIFDVEAKLYLLHNVIKAGKAGESILEAADKVKKEIERQLLRVKAKRQADKRRNRRAVREARGKG